MVDRSRSDYRTGVCLRRGDLDRGHVVSRELSRQETACTRGRSGYLGPAFALTWSHLSLIGNGGGSWYRPVTSFRRRIIPNNLILAAGLGLCLSAPVAAYQVDIWTGAGPNACRSACSLEWALTRLTAQERALVEAAMIAQPFAEPLAVPDGAVFTMMSYQKNGQPIAYRRTTIAVLDQPELAYGWVLDGFAFVRLEACGNWAILIYDQPPEPKPRWTPPKDDDCRQCRWAWFPFGGGGGGGDDPRPPGQPPENPPVTPIPLPATVWALLASMLAVLMVRRRR